MIALLINNPFIIPNNILFVFIDPVISKCFCDKVLPYLI